MKTFLFYDIETSGLNPAFDQILTFAAIRTDLQLNEVARHELTVRLRRDIIPSPKAFLTHGLTPDILSQGISEYEAALEIHKLLNTPNTISLGYNSLGFDDEFLRFTFYRNLLDPYSHQYAKGCSRMDILPMTAVFKVFCPECLVWPSVDGKPSLKLDLISQANEFEVSGRAHEAMSDVEALVSLSRRFSEQKAVWEYCLDFFNKQRDEVRIHQIEPEFQVREEHFRLCIMVSAAFGPDANYLAPVLHIGQSAPYKNQSLWLRLDSDDILGLESNAGVEDTFVMRKRPADALIVLPPLERFWQRLSDQSRQTCEDNMEKIRRNREKFSEYIDYHRSFRYPDIPDIDPDAALYQDGFFSSQEKKDCERFHSAIKDNVPDQVSSPRIRRLAKRILARNFDDAPCLPIEIQTQINRLKSVAPEDQIVGFRNDSKFNLEKGLNELEEIRREIQNPDPEQKKLIGWLSEYLGNL